MKIGTINLKGKETLIVKIDDERAAKLSSVYKAANAGKAPKTLQKLIEKGDKEIEKACAAADKAAANPDSVKTFAIESIDDWMPPQPRPSKMLNVAVNNNDLNNVAYKVPTQPMIFNKPISTLWAHNKTIELMPEHAFTVPEPELACVIKKGGKNIAVEDALDHVLGWTIQNDLTASGVKFNIDSVALKIGNAGLRPHHTAWREKFGEEDSYLYFTYHTRSKGSDTFTPMGPWLVINEDIDPSNVQCRGWANEDHYTEDNTKNYMFSPAYAISEASRYFTFKPGDIFSFGTAGLGVGKYKRGNRDVNLQDFQSTTCEFDGIGKLHNPIKIVENHPVGSGKVYTKSQLEKMYERDLVELARSRGIEASRDDLKADTVEKILTAQG